MSINRLLSQTLFIVILLTSNVLAMFCPHKLPRRGCCRWTCGGAAKVVPVIEAPAFIEFEREAPTPGITEAEFVAIGFIAPEEKPEYKDGELWEPETLIRLDFALNELYAYIIDIKSSVINPIVIFDIDGTVLIEDGSIGIYVLKSVLGFYNKLKIIGINCIFLTARPMAGVGYALGELRALGCDEGHLICLPNDFANISEEVIGRWKESKRVELSTEKTILATLDDQLPNLKGRCLGVAVKIPMLSAEQLEADTSYVDGFRKLVEFR